MKDIIILLFLLIQCVFYYKAHTLLNKYGKEIKRIDENLQETNYWIIERELQKALQEEDYLRAERCKKILDGRKSN